MANAACAAVANPARAEYRRRPGARGPMTGANAALTRARMQGAGPIDFYVGDDSPLENRVVNMSDLFWLTEGQMARLGPFFPKSHGKPRAKDRRVLIGII